jgi:hypothetical protein
MAKKKKTSKSLKQARSLGKSKYAPALELLNRQRNSNRQSYDTASQQRVSALNAEMGSLEAADKATKEFLNTLKSRSGTVYQQAMEKSQKANLEAQTNRQNANTALLSRMQADAINRGLSDTSAAETSTKLTESDSILSGIGEMNRGAIERMGLISQGSIDNASIGTQMVANTAKSNARGAATSNLDELYRTYQSERSKLESEEVKTQLEKQDYVNQMYMTLKEKAAAAKAAKAQAAMQARIASGNLAFRNTKLKIDTQYKYDKLASDTAQKEIANKLKEQGFSHKKALDLAKLALQKRGSDLQWDKFNWSKANPSASASANLADLVASIR